MEPKTKTTTTTKIEIYGQIINYYNLYPQIEWIEFFFIVVEAEEETKLIGKRSSLQEQQQQYQQHLSLSLERAKQCSSSSSRR